MSPVEIAYRVRQALLAHLQRYGVLTAARVPAPNMTAWTAPFVALDLCMAADRYQAAADALLAGKLSIFGSDHVFSDPPSWNKDPKTGRVAPLTFGKTLDYRDPALVGNIKYLWEPNRHLHVATLAQAYRLTKQQRRYLEGLRAHIESWLDQCPYLLGPNWTSSLELAIRLINWSIVWQLIDGLDSSLFSDRRGQALRNRWLGSIYQHMHFIRGHLSRYSSANNHLIGELAGLYIGTHTWPYWRQTKDWGEYAKKHLIHQALIQNAPDGVNREQAVSYQQFVLDFLLLAALTGRARGDDFPVDYWQRIERMLEFVAALMDVRGNIPMIGDADDGYVVRLSQERDFCPYRSLLATGAVLFHRPDFKFKARSLDDKTRWLVGRAGTIKFKDLEARRPTLRRHFPEGGYYVLGSEFDTEREIRIVVDAGPLGYQSIAAHGHADALAFTLSLGGHEFLIDPGTYAYHTDPEWRAYFRGTRAHNTVCIDGEDQSLQGGAFLWLKHAIAKCTRWEEREDGERFVGEHDGYRRLADPVTHRRELTFTKCEKRLEVVDTIECRGRHVVERYWHFAEDVGVSVAPDGTVTAAKDGYALRMRPSDKVSSRTYYAQSHPPAGWISRRFDAKTATHTVVWANEVNGSSRCGAVLECLLPTQAVNSPNQRAHDTAGT